MNQARLSKQYGQVSVMKVIVCLLVLGCFVANINLYAADTVVSKWSLSDVSGQSRSLTVNYQGPAAVFGAGSLTGNVSNSSLTISNLNVDISTAQVTAYESGTTYVAGGVGYIGSFTNNKLDILNGSTITGRTVFGGLALLENIDKRSQTGVASGNIVNVVDSAIVADTFLLDPSDPSTEVTVGGDVIGGAAMYANATIDNNTVTVNNSTAVDVIGAVRSSDVILESLDVTNGVLSSDVGNIQANGNTVIIENGSQIKGTFSEAIPSPTNTLTGGIVAAAYDIENANNNTVIIDGATTEADVVSAVLRNTDNDTIISSSGYSFNNNSVIVRNGAKVNYFLTAVNHGPQTTSNNLLQISDNSITPDSLYTAVLSPSTGDLHAVASGNKLVYQDFTAAQTKNEMLAVLNVSGSANENSVLISNVGNLVVSNPQSTINPITGENNLFFQKLDFATLGTEQLISVQRPVSTLPLLQVDQTLTDNGFISGGVSYEYTTQLNDLVPHGTTVIVNADGTLPEAYTTVPSVDQITNAFSSSALAADGNTVTIKDSTVSSNIAGSVAGQVQEISYATYSYTPASGSDPANYQKTIVQKVGNKITTTVYDCGGDPNACPDPSDPATIPVSTETETASNYSGNTISASNNTVILENANVTGTVYGGYAFGADISASNVKTENNTVILRGNTTVTGTIYGGTSDFGQTTNKLVFDHISSGDPSVYVSYDPEDFQNFSDTYQINADLDTRIDFNSTGVKAVVNVDQSIGEGAAHIIKTESNIDLTDVDQNANLVDLTDSSIQLANEKQGLYSFSLAAQKGTGSEIEWVLTSAKDASNVELYGQVPLVGLALATEGADLLSNTFAQAWSSEEDHNVFLNGGYNHTRYITGSGFDLDSGLAQAGLWAKFTSDWLGGFYAKYSGGHYKTFPIDASGDASAYGGGLMTSYFFTESSRVEAGAEVGYMRLEFNSDALSSTLKSKGMYYGLTGGFVQTILSDWDLYARVQYVHKDSDDMKDNLGQSIEYSAMNSLSTKFGTIYRFGNVNWDGLTPMVGLSGLYEFDGESKVNVAGMSNDKASLKGFSGRADIGLTFSNVGSSAILPIISQLTVFGQAGNRRGFGGEVNISVQF